MRIQFDLGRYRVEVRRSYRFKIGKHTHKERWYDSHGYAWTLYLGFFFVYILDADLENVATCAVCGSTEIGEQSCGDEGWTVCDNCGSVEQGYEYISYRDAEERGLI